MFKAKQYAILIGCLLEGYLPVSSIMNAELIKTPQHMFPLIEERIFNHQGDNPYPTDMTFRKFADHILDKTTVFFDPDSVKKGDTIYLADWYMQWFTTEIHPKIKCPYILISSESDLWHPQDRRSFVWEDLVPLYDPKIAAWFCRNMILSKHAKIVQIPIGQNIIYWGNFIKDYFINWDKHAQPDKDIVLYMNMQLASHSTRPYIAKLFEDQEYCFSRINFQVPTSQNVIRAQFHEELSRSFFTLAPPGYGPDITRFWEAIVLDCIPIVKHSVLDDLYSDLPVLFVSEWEQINLEFLMKKYQEIKNQGFGKKKAYFDYWACKILEFQQKIRDNQNDFSYLEATQFKPSTLENISIVLKKVMTNNSDRLIFKGAVTGLRPFELVQKCSFLSGLYVQDRWGATSQESPVRHLEEFTQNTLLREKDKIIPLNHDDDTIFLYKEDSKTHLFFDLSYLRHDLKEDLEKYYMMLRLHTCFCGNMADDEYVRKVLAQFSDTFQLEIQFEGDIWYFKKVI
jgi:hypothetical protein